MFSRYKWGNVFISLSLCVCVYPRVQARTYGADVLYVCVCWRGKVASGIVKEAYGYNNLLCLVLHLKYLNIYKHYGCLATFWKKKKPKLKLMPIMCMCDELVTSWCFRVCMYMMQFRSVMLLFLCCDFLRPHCNFSFEIIKFTLPYLTLQQESRSPGYRIPQQKEDPQEKKKLPRRLGVVPNCVPHSSSMTSCIGYLTMSKKPSTQTTLFYGAVKSMSPLHITGFNRHSNDQKHGLSHDLSKSMKRRQLWPFLANPSNRVECAWN